MMLLTWFIKLIRGHVYVLFKHCGLVVGMWFCVNINYIVVSSVHNCIAEVLLLKIWMAVLSC